MREVRSEPVESNDGIPGGFDSYPDMAAGLGTTKSLLTAFRERDRTSWRWKNAPKRKLKGNSVPFRVRIVRRSFTGSLWSRRLAANLYGVVSRNRLAAITTSIPKQESRRGMQPGTSCMGQTFHSRRRATKARIPAPNRHAVERCDAARTPYLCVSVARLRAILR